MTSGKTQISPGLGFPVGKRGMGCDPGPLGAPPPSPHGGPSCWVLTARGAVSGPRGPALCPLMPPFSLAEIIFLRAVTPAHPANHADIIFDITDGNLRDSFDIIKRYMDGMTVGEWPETSGPSGRAPPPAQPVGL